MSKKAVGDLALGGSLLGEDELDSKSFLLLTPISPGRKPSFAGGDHTAGFQAI
jgi:hypothetical protein